MPDPKKISIKREPGDPYFRNREEFDKFYKNKAYKALKAKGDVYVPKGSNAYSSEGVDVSVAKGANIPDYDKWRASEKSELAAKPKRVSLPDSGKPKTGGYRYNSGKGKPAKGSLTNRLKRRKPY